MKKNRRRIEERKGLVHLPTKLIQKIEEDIFYSNIRLYSTKNNHLHCLKILYHKQISEYHNKAAYVPTGSSYWKTVFGGDYMNWITPLKEKGCLETREFKPSYLDNQNGAGEVLIRYRIRPELLNDEIGITRYLEKGEKAPPKKIEIREQKYFPKEYNSKHFHLSFDKDAANKWVEENARNICNEYLQYDFVDSLPPEMVIPFREFISGGTYEHRYLPIRKAKHRGIFLGKKLFFFNKEFILAEMEQFFEFRKQGIIDHYKCQINVVNSLPMITDRNDTNYRLHNYLTNFPSLLLPFLKIFNYPLVQIDLSTSQFTLLANILNTYLYTGAVQLLSLFKKPETKKYLKKLVGILDDHKMILPSSGTDSALFTHDNDVLAFIDDVLYDDFYKKVGEILNIENRGIAKQVTFQMIFRQTARSNQLIDKLKDYYPTVFSIIDTFKNNLDCEQEEEENGNLAVMLQCVEAEIFIDKILLPLQKQGYPCFSRHDSISTTKPLQAKVLSEMEVVFENLNFIHRFKIEDLSESFQFNDEKIEMDDHTDPIDFETVEDIDDEAMDLASYVSQDTMDLLLNIGEQEDYSTEINHVALEEMSNLPYLNQREKNCLIEDSINIISGITHLQDQTNQVITKVITNYL